MASKYFRISVLVGLSAALSSAGAFAADYSPPPPIYIPPPVVQEFASSWYLRGDIGMSNQKVKNLTNPAATSPLNSSSYGFDSAPIFGIGIGYNWNDWLRLDVTGEYRGRSNFHGSEVYVTPTGNFTDEYTGSKSEWLFLANAYVDLGTWYGLTPFIGAGVGTVRIGIHNFQDVCHGCGGNPANNGVSFASDSSKWNFAWALHAGVGYKVTKNFTVELAYRYLDMGDAVTGNLVSYDGTQVLSPSTFEHVTSHDIKLGLRYNFDEGISDFWSRPRQTYIAPAPVYTQPAPVYAPAPVYSQPAPVYQPPIYQPPVYQPPVYQPPIRSRG